MEVMAIVILIPPGLPRAVLEPAGCALQGSPVATARVLRRKSKTNGDLALKNWNFTSKNGEFSASNRGIYPDKLTTEFGFLQFQILRQQRFMISVSESIVWKCIFGFFPSFCTSLLELHFRCPRS
jgi:hypothetical protein